MGREKFKSTLVTQYNYDTNLKKLEIYLIT